MSPEDLAKALTQPGRASIPYFDRYNPDRPLVLLPAAKSRPRQAGHHRAAWSEPQWRGIL